MTPCPRCGATVTIPDPIERERGRHVRVCPCVVRVRDELAALPPRGQLVAVMVEGKCEWWIVGPALPVQKPARKDNHEVDKTRRR